jgi:hypothetical protein
VRYSLNFPIQPDEGDKDTLFGIEYTVPSSNSFTFHPQVSLHTQAVGVLLPKSMGFAAGSNSAFQSAPGDSSVQTFLVRNLVPGKALAFTVSGAGSIPQEPQSDEGGQTVAVSGKQPGGGIGAPIDTPTHSASTSGGYLDAWLCFLQPRQDFFCERPRERLRSLAQKADQCVACRAHHALLPQQYLRKQAPFC